MNNINEYKRLLSIISSYHHNPNNTILKELLNYLTPIKKNRFLNINFNTQFFISNVKQDKFVKYDKTKNVFYLYIDESKRRFDELSNISYSNFINIDFNNIYRNYKTEELSYLINNKKMKFDDYIIGEFYKELLLNIIDLTYGETIDYKDEYVNYCEKRGNFINEVFVELFLRRFSQKYNLPYLPSKIDGDILKNLKTVFYEENFSIILNNTLADLYNKVNGIMISNIINEYEEKKFEEKYKIKKGLLYNLELEFINQKSPYLRKYEIKKSLIDIKKDFENNNLDNSKMDWLLNKLTESSSTSSSGFANIIILVIFVSSLILSGIFLALILLHIS